MEPEDIGDRLHRWRNARHVVDLHPATVRRRGEHVTVRIPFPLTPPDTPPEAYRSVILTCTLTPEDLRQLATLPRIVFADVMSAYVGQAANECFPPPAPRRRTQATLLKWEAACQAQRMYPTIKWLLNEWPRLPKAPPHRWFPDLQAAVQDSQAGTPTALDITAWVIERLFAPAWERCGLQKPTEHDHFAKDYLYTKRRGRGPDYMPYELEKLVRPLLP